MGLFKRSTPPAPAVVRPVHEFEPDELADSAWHWIKPVEHCLIAAEMDGQIVTALGNVLGVCGWKGEDLVGKPLPSIIPERHRAMHNHGWQRFLDTGEAPALGYTFATVAQGPNEEHPVWLTVFGVNPKSQLVLGLLEIRVPEEHINAT